MSENPILPPKQYSENIELIVNFLNSLALPSMHNRKLTERDYELWDALLEPYTRDELHHAFDSWGRGENKWPCPADITKIAAAYRATNNAMEAQDLPGGRDKLRGGWLALYVMMNRVSKRIDSFSEAKLRYVPLTDAEIDALWNDSKEAASQIESRRTR